MSDPNNEKNYTQFTKKVTVGCYIALAVAVLFFSGLLNNVEGFKWLSALDFRLFLVNLVPWSTLQKIPLLGKAASALAQVSSLPWA